MELLKPEFTHTDSRRCLIQLLTSDIKQINAYQAKKGAVLGDHFHKDTTEYFLLCEGEISYNDSVSIPSGTLFVVKPGENHKITCLTDITLLTFLDIPFDKNKPDLHKESK
jgi:quercetin dioxygenase-like cupin family protein